MSSITTLAVLNTRVTGKLGSIDTPGLQPSSGDVDNFVQEGLDILNNLRPDVVTREVTGDGTTRRYDLETLFSGIWIHEFTILTSLTTVSNANTDDEDEDPVFDKDFRVHRHTDGLDYLYMRNVVGADRVLRFRFTTPWLIHASDAAQTTVPDKYAEVLVSLCAARGALWISRKASDLAVTTLGASEVDYGSSQEKWMDNSKAMMKEAMDVLSPDIAAVSAGTTREWRETPRLHDDEARQPTGFRERLSH